MSRSAIWGTTKATNSSGPTAETATAARPTAVTRISSWVQLQPDAEPAGGVVAELHGVEGAHQQQGDGDAGRPGSTAAGSPAPSRGR